jgi:putative ABC transport system substrate-binding protein
MDRRRFLLTSLAGVLAAPLGAGAQQARKVPRIGWLNASWRGSAEAQAGLEALWQGLREHGYIEGRNLLIEYRWAEGISGVSGNSRWNSRA